MTAQGAIPTVPTVPTTPVLTPERVKQLRDQSLDWEIVMANALAQFEFGNMEHARFLLDFAQEIRRMRYSEAEEFEDLRTKLENGS